MSETRKIAAILVADVVGCSGAPLLLSRIGVMTRSSLNCKVIKPGR